MLKSIPYFVAAITFAQTNQYTLIAIFLYQKYVEEYVSALTEENIFFYIFLGDIYYSKK